MKFISETALFQPVVAWLKSQRYWVGQDVEFTRDAIADIAAVSVRNGTPCLHVLEGKLLLNLHLLAQAYRWKGRANCVSIVLPNYTDRESIDWTAACRFCTQNGIGIMLAMPNGVEAVRAPLVTDADLMSEGLIAALRPQHATFTPAGSAGVKRYEERRESRRTDWSVLSRVVHDANRALSLGTALGNAGIAEQGRRQALTAAKAGQIQGVTAVRLSGQWFLKVQDSGGTNKNSD